MQTDRRRKRSSYASLALHYWLRSVADRTGAFAFVLADTSGLLIASSIKGPEAEELAAIAPFLARGRVDGSTFVRRYSVPMCIHDLQINQTPMLLCAIGTDEKTWPALDQAADGVVRILVN